MKATGSHFSAAGDPVNALAGFYYGFGWLHFGLSSGLLAITASPGVLFGTSGVTSATVQKKLEEKAYRYARPAGYCPLLSEMCSGSCHDQSWFR